MNSGNFDRVDPRINKENFPLLPSFQFNGAFQLLMSVVDQIRTTSLESVIAVIQEFNCRSGSLYDLIAIATMNLSVLPERPIFALGSEIDLDGNRYFPSFQTINSKRVLSLGLEKGIQWDRCNFLAIPN